MILDFISEYMGSKVVSSTFHRKKLFTASASPRPVVSLKGTPHSDSATWTQVGHRWIPGTLLKWYQVIYGYMYIWFYTMVILT